MSLPVCRVCMNKSLEYIDLESPLETNKEYTYMESFNQSTKLNASYSDQLPKNLCSDCAVRLAITFDFIKKAEEADKIFKMQLCFQSKPENDAHRNYQNKPVTGDQLFKAEGTIINIVNQIDENVDICCEYRDETIQKLNVDSPDFLQESIDCLHMCNVCNISFLNEQAFQRHYKQDHAVQVKEEIEFDKNNVLPFSESKSMEFQSQSDNVKKENLEDPKRVLFKCDKCDKSFDSSIRFEYHQNWHNGIRPYSCSHCENDYFSKIMLDLHTKRVHSNIPEEQCIEHERESPEPTSQTSEKMGIEVNNEEEPEIDQPNNATPIKCCECKKTFSSRTLLASHTKRLHNKKAAIFLCSSCPKIFKNSTLLRNHEKIHTNREIKFTCEHCGKGFFMRNSYIAHLKIHNPDRPKYTCKICNRNFSFSTGLTMHMKIHKGGDFECMQCGKRFVRSNDLEIHIRFHTGDYPYQCNVCNKRFAIKSHLKEHLVRHSGIKVKCNLCNAEFVNKSTLRSHMYIHSEMPFNCTHCNKGFNSRYKIKRHILHVHKIPVSEDEFDQLFPKKNVIHEKNINLEDESQNSNNT